MGLTGVLAGWALAACAPAQGPIYVEQIQPVQVAGSSCNFVPMADIYIDQFRLLDVAAGEPDVNLILRVKGADITNAAQPPLNVGGRELEPAGRDKPEILRTVLRYTTTSRPALPGFTTALVDTLPATAKVGNPTLFPVSLFGPRAREKLADLAPSNTDTYDVVVSIELQGQFLPSTQPWRAAPVSFPVRIVKSEVKCPGGNTNRLQRYNPADARGLQRLCTYSGLEARVTEASCCTNAPNMPDPSIPGCD